MSVEVEVLQTHIRSAALHTASLSPFSWQRAFSQQYVVAASAWNASASTMHSVAFIFDAVKGMKGYEGV